MRLDRVSKFDYLWTTISDSTKNHSYMMSAATVYSKLKNLLVTEQPKITSIYTERINCLQELAKLQKLISDTDEEYISISLIEGKAHENAFNRLGTYQENYKHLYSKCEKMIKPST